MDHLPGRRTLASPEVALANQVFDHFCNATTLKSIVAHFRHLCDLLKIQPSTVNQFYPKLKAKLRSWKAQALWKKFDQRANHKCYNRGKACQGTRALIIGGGPCGLRSAIEAQLLGAKVVVVEKRDRLSRNNVLHLWPFVIQDLRALGAKKFFGKFCAGSIDHISIRQLQCILLKVALLLGVEFHENVSFEALVEPPENQEEAKIGWRAKTVPADHPVSQYEFDVLIGADGKRNTLEGFKRKEFRGKLAIAITANFINRRTEAEARVEEISGVAFIFNQKFFKELYQETGIDLENIVYYKDDTHYFVMTAKKHSLIDKGVILQDHVDTAKLLAKDNVDREALMRYAREAADFSTEYQMMDMEFAVNHYGQPDVAMFDFTSMYAAENASRVIERRGHRLLMTLVGDSLLEPFWPTGSGCARGFLSSMDACWAIKSWGASVPALQVLAERESIYRLLGQTTPENLNRDYGAYTLDPHTRYPNLNIRSVTPAQVRSQIDSDDPEILKLPSLETHIELPKKRRRRDTQLHPDTLLNWLRDQVALHTTLEIVDLAASFKSGLALAAIVHRYRPDLLDFNGIVDGQDPAVTNQLVFDILEKELGIPPIMTGQDMADCECPDKLRMFTYLTQVYETFRKDIPQTARTSRVDLEIEEAIERHHVEKIHYTTRVVKQDFSTTRVRRSRQINDSTASISEKKTEAARRSKKRRSNEKMGASVEERTKRLEEIENNRIERMKKRQYQRKKATEQFYKSMRMLQGNAKRDNKHEPFEDYSIFLYRQTAPDFKERVNDLEQKILYPDRESKIRINHRYGGGNENFSGRIKNFEDKLKGQTSSEKRPKDLLRAIGKIEKSDWNVKEIEKKIEESKTGRGMRQDKVERVPKWSREQFLARQTKMEKKGREPMEIDSKYAAIDNTIKNIDKKIKEGNVLGHNKVSAMAEQFANKNQDIEPKVQKSSSKVIITLPAQGGSEICHFCQKRVYLMERLTAESKSFHRGCFRCEYCFISLRIGNHTFDREKDRFYCSQHFGLAGTIKNKLEKKTPLTNKENIFRTPTKANNEKARSSLDGVVSLDLLERGQTPERIEFENLAEMSDTEEAHSQMDEDEWTDRNFGPSAAELCSSDDMSSSSDSEEDNEVYEEALEQPLTTEGTLELAKNWTLRYSNTHLANTHSDTGSNEYEDSDDYSSTEEESGTATEDEENVRAARELRKKEVWLETPLRVSDTETGSETEIASEESAEQHKENSATEISTDSEFEHDGTTVQYEIPKITINDAYVRKTRGDYVAPKKIQVKSHLKDSVKKVEAQKKKTESITNSVDKESTVTSNTQNLKTTISNLNSCKGQNYSLNRTQSTEGIASKLSLELKKKYLLGSTGIGGSISKSGSTSNVIDTKLRNMSDSISQYQKLLNPAPEPSPTMQAFLQCTNNFRSVNNHLSPLSPSPLFNNQVKVFPFDKKKDELTTPRAERNHLPDLIKETNNAEIKETSVVNKKFELANISLTNIESMSDDVTPTNQENYQITDNIAKEDNKGSRSPLHETSIIVPQVDWGNNKNEESKDKESSEESEIDSDSLSTSGVESNEGERTKNNVNLLPPRLQIHSTEGDLLLDEQVVERKDADDAMNFEPDSIEYTGLVESPIENNGYYDNTFPHNQDKEVRFMTTDLEKLHLQNIRKHSSNCSSPGSMHSEPSKNELSEDNDITTAAYTETELSEWARDGDALVSESLQQVENNINPNVSNRKKLSDGSIILNADEEDWDDNNEQDSKELNNRTHHQNTLASRLINSGDDIGFMDTDNESVLDDSLQETDQNIFPKNRGYIEFVNYSKSPSVNSAKNESAPAFNEAPIAITENDFYSDEDKTDENVIKINPITYEDVADRLNGAVNKNVISCDISIKSVEDCDKHKPSMEIVKEVCLSMDEDSLLVIEQAEDTTNSEITNTVLASPFNPQSRPVPDVFDKSKTEVAKNTENNHESDYLEYVNRIQHRIAEFSNAKDSMDVRKKRKNSKSSLQSQTAEMISEEIKSQEDIANNANKSPATSRKLEEITKERSKQKILVQNLLMDKFEAQKQKSAEKRAKRAARSSSFTACPSISPMRPPPTPPALASVDDVFITDTMNKNSESHNSIDNPGSENNINANDDQSTKEHKFSKPYGTQGSLQDDVRKTAEKAKQDARERARLKSDEDLGLSPDDKIKQLKAKVARRQLIMDNEKKSETTDEVKTKRYSFGLIKSGNKLQMSKSTGNVKAALEPLSITTKSLDELLQDDNQKADVVHRREKPKTKDPERRRSIIQAVSDFFKRKDSSSSPSSPSSKDKSSIFRVSPKSKDKPELDKITQQFGNRPKSICEGMLDSFYNPSQQSPLSPPINYSLFTNTSEGSLSEEDSKTAVISSSQMDQTSNTADSCNNVAVNKTKVSKRTMRRIQLKRLRMAQEIQRKLEEIEVKQKELESQGVDVEKALRGEGDCLEKDESELLQEWFDLMRQSKELRRYEKELLVKAQELQLEDRHDRLQQELQERLADDDKKKTSSDVKKEGEILTEMLEIVSKRDSLIALLEEDRQRYQEEDRDLEAQMLAKGLKVTINHCDPEY